MQVAATSRAEAPRLSSGVHRVLAAARAAVRVADGDEEPGVARLTAERAAKSERLLNPVVERASRRTPSLSLPLPFSLMRT